VALRIIRKSVSVVVLICLILVSPVGAQEEEEKPAGIGGPRRQLAVIIFAGLGGAILGLSTLSFYGRPQEKLANIAVGFALGVITGTIYVTYRAATIPRQSFATLEPYEKFHWRPPATGPPTLQLGYKF